MKKATTLIVVISMIALAGCENLTPRERVVAGGVAGATVGLLTASALSAKAGWTLVAVLAGATAGTLVARNHQTGMCAYARRDGRYDTRPCR